MKVSRSSAFTIRVGQWANGIPQVAISSFAGWDSPSSTLSSPTTEIEASDTVSLVKGPHSLKLGVMIMRNRKDQNGRSNYDGNIAFATTTPNTTGYALSDALLGNFATYTEAAYDPIGFYRYTEPSVFVDDSWKVSRKLTINLGMRFEYMMAMYSTANNLTDFVPSMFNFAQAVKINSSGQVVAELRQHLRWPAARGQWYPFQLRLRRSQRHQPRRAGRAGRRASRHVSQPGRVATPRGLRLCHE